MKQITVRKEALREKVVEAMRQHATNYDKAMRAYAEQVRQAASSTNICACAFLDGKADFLQKLEESREKLDRLQTPTCHVRDYQRVLEMLDLEVGETVTLDLQGYRQFVEDDWDWVRHSKMVINSYNSPGN